MEDLAREVARLADAIGEARRLLEARERERRHERLAVDWGEEMTPFGIRTLLTAIPGLAGRFDRVVPPEFVTAADGGLTVTCPCGEAPTVRAGRLEGCPCGRWFLHDGERVHVALSPVEPDHHAILTKASA